MFNKKRNKEKQIIEDEKYVPKAFRKNKEQIKDRDKKENKKINRKNIQKSNSKNNKNKIKKGKHKIIKFIIIVFLITIIILGVVLGISSNHWKKLAKEMVANKNSVVLDTNGKEIAKLGCERKNKQISLSDMPNNLKNAYVAIEDERFYSHHGVDIKRTGGAILSYIIHIGGSSYGGSTITQQLVKNLTGDTTDSITRKIKEWWKAWQLEKCLSKDEILEAYLNIIYVGPNMYGVETASQYYFSKSSTNLSLEECAFLAGMNNSPNSYNPFGEKDNTEKINKRTKIVLAKMLELNYIDKDSYNSAINNVDKGLKFKKGKIETESAVYSYHTDELISEITKDISKKYHISEAFATYYINMAGLTIHSTQDSNIQNITEKEFEKSKYSISSKNGGNSSQAAMVIIDHKTGNVLGCVGGLGKKTEVKPLNRATQSIRQTGSSIKPLSVLIPAIDKKIITASSIYDDTEQDFAEGYHPTDYNKPLGKITVRRAVESSQNIPFVEIMQELKPKSSIKYLKKMGISTLTKEDETLVLSLGGLQKGISPLEMAAAYAMISNDGVYIEPTFYTTINNKTGETIVKAHQTKRRVVSSDVAYIVKELLTQPVNGTKGTATYCKISGVDVAAKTGTTDENYDRWLCGFTPYYTAVTWYGYDVNETIEYNKKNPAGLIWTNVMSRIHTGLKSATFEKPTSVSRCTICADTGKMATTGCPNTYVENFLRFTMPDLCDKHSGSEYNKNSNNNNTIHNIQDTIKEITQDIDVLDPQQIETNTNNEEKYNNVKNNTNTNSLNKNDYNKNNNQNDDNRENQDKTDTSNAKNTVTNSSSSDKNSTNSGFNSSNTTTNKISNND